MEHSSRYHCELGPSSAKRWRECPGSVQASRGLPDKSSIFADEGTAAHELANHCLEAGWDTARFRGWSIDIHAETKGAMFVQGREPDPENGIFAVDEEMVDGVQQYVDRCRSIAEQSGVVDGGEVIVEERVHVSDDPEINGTCDFGAYDAATKTVYVVDLKYGRGVSVHPRENPQAMLYALGLCNRFHNRGVDRVSITIAQPRSPHDEGPVRTWECSPVDLLEFEADIIDAGKLALSEEGAAIFNAGEWCKDGFCPRRGSCKVYDAWNVNSAVGQFVDLSQGYGNVVLPDPFTLSGEELAERLSFVESLTGWIKVIVAHGHAEAEQGRKIPGWKLVAKRATRRWKDKDAALEFADMVGLDESDLYQEPKLRTPADLEGFAPGKNKKLRAEFLAEFVTKESSGTVLAREQDKRPEVRKDAAGQFVDLSDEVDT